MWLFGIPGIWSPNHSQLIMSNLNKAACVLHAEHKQQHPAICANLESLPHYPKPLLLSYTVRFATYMCIHAACLGVLSCRGLWAWALGTAL